MPYVITVLPSAARAIASLPQDDQRRVVRKIDGLADDPRPAQAKLLASKERLWRLRVGDYRIIYQVDDGKKRILIVAIGHRRDVYRRI